MVKCIRLINNTGKSQSSSVSTHTFSVVPSAFPAQWCSWCALGRLDQHPDHEQWQALLYNWRIAASKYIQKGNLPHLLTYLASYASVPPIYHHHRSLGDVDLFDADAHRLQQWFWLLTVDSQLVLIGLLASQLDLGLVSMPITMPSTWCS